MRVNISLGPCPAGLALGVDEPGERSVGLEWLFLTESFGLFKFLDRWVKDL